MQREGFFLPASPTKMREKKKHNARARVFGTRREKLRSTARTFSHARRLIRSIKGSCSFNPRKRTMVTRFLLLCCFFLSQKEIRTFRLCVERLGKETCLTFLREKKQKQISTP
jgi:hypothetical protein